jgi:hypothetical protein
MVQDKAPLKASLSFQPILRLAPDQPLDTNMGEEFCKLKRPLEATTKFNDGIANMRFSARRQAIHRMRKALEASSFKGFSLN